MVWNKRGNTGGGASSGRSGTKRGGSGKNPVSDSTSTSDCPSCQGVGEVGTPNTEKD